MKERPRFRKDNVFVQEYWVNVKADVERLFSNTKKKKVGGMKIKIKTLIFYTILITGLYVLYVHGATLPWWQVLLIYTLICAPMGAFIGMNTMHEGSHGTFSSKKWLNSVATWSNVLFVGGLPINWKVEHVDLHHPFTNIYGIDEDFSSAEKFILFNRFSKWLKVHRKQEKWYYIFLIYCQMTLSWIFLTDIGQTIRYLKLKKHGFIKKYPKAYLAWTYVICAKLFVFFFWIYIPIVWTGISGWLVVSGFIVMHQVMGMILSHIFQPAHINEYTGKYSNEDLLSHSWHTHQFLTSIDFAVNSPIVTELSGGLNYQKPHHLFHGITHQHYPEILQIMHKHFQSMKQKHGDKFTLVCTEFTTLREAIVNNYSHVKSHAVPISFEV